MRTDNMSDKKHYAIDKSEVGLIKIVRVKTNLKKMEIMDYSIRDKLYENFKQGKFCDITLVVPNGRRIPTHRVVLSSANGYFETLLKKPKEETQEKTEIIVEGIEGDILYSLVEFCYTGKIDMFLENVDSLLHSASMLRFTRLAQKCTEFYAETLNASKCLGIWVFANQFNYRELKEVSFKFCCEKFMQIVESEEFVLLERSFLLELLRNDNIKVASEEDVFTAMARWYEYDLKSRKRFVQNMLKVVRVQYLDKTFVFQNVRLWCKQNANPQLYMKISERIHTVKSEIVWPERPSTVLGRLLAIGGSVDATKSFTIEEYCPRLNVWEHFHSFPQERFLFGTVLVENKLLIIGGSGQHGNVLSDVDSLDLQTLEIKKLAPMTTARSAMSTALLDGHIYVIGGWDQTINFNSVERYNTASNEWSDIAPMSVARQWPASAILNGNLFVTGGSDRDQVHNSAEVYVADSNKWKSIAPMIEMRESHQAGAANGFLYVCGNGGPELSSTIERYDPEANNWTLMSFSLPVPRACFAMFIFKNWAYVGGGQSRTELKTELFERINLTTGECVPLKAMRSKKSSFHFIQLKT